MIPVKIGFVLLSNSRHPIPSTRIAALNMFPFLRAANFEPHIVFEPDQGTQTPDVSGLAPRLLKQGFHIVVFQKVHGPSVKNLARQLRAAGIRTVYCVCDLVDVDMTEATDVTITVTEYLKSLYPFSLQSKIRVVHDGIEYPEVYKMEWGMRRATNNRPLRAVLVTSAKLDRLPIIVEPPKWLHVTIVGRYLPIGETLQRLREARWTFSGQRDGLHRIAYLRFLISRHIRCSAWNAIEVYERMKDADIGIIPIEVLPMEEPGRPPHAWEVKSENRLSMKMCMGLPVIATPIPAYEPVVKQGENAFLARSRQDWITYLDALRDPGLREEMGRQARESVLERYSKQKQARLLIDTLEDLIGDDSRS